MHISNRGSHRRPLTLRRTQGQPERGRGLTLALIGAGRWGTNIRRTLEQLSGCRLAYVVTHDWRALLELPDLDGVLIATPGTTHATISRPFIERGIATFIEKPLTTTLRDARALQRAARRSGARVFVGHVHLFNPAYEAAKRAVRTAGRVRFIVGEGMNNGPYRDDMSCLWDWGPHDLALTLDLLGELPTSVQTWGARTLRPRTRLHDVVQLHLEFPRGVHGFYTFSWTMPEKRKRFTVVGTRDTVVFDDTADRKVTVFRGMGPTVAGKRIEWRKPVVGHPPYAATPPLQRELEAFLRVVRRRTSSPSDIDHAVDTVRVLDAAERSLHASGRRVTLAR